jgi:hypothetical protein
MEEQYYSITLSESICAASRYTPDTLDLPDAVFSVGHGSETVICPKEPEFSRQTVDFDD